MYNQQRSGVVRVFRNYFEKLGVKCGAPQRRLLRNQEFLMTFHHTVVWCGVWCLWCVCVFLSSQLFVRRKLWLRFGYREVCTILPVFCWMFISREQKECLEILKIQWDYS